MSDYMRNAAEHDWHDPPGPVDEPDDGPLWLACPCGEPSCDAVCPHQDARGEDAAACECHCCLAAEYRVALELEAGR